MNIPNDIRLFKENSGEVTLTPCMINQLADFMIEKQYQHDSSTTKKLSFSESSNILHAGYTYLGQFISHDIVPPTSTTKKNQSRTVTPQLNLDSLYGVPSLYSFLFEENGKFRLSPRQYDVLRDEKQKALIPESRNDENAIIIQFHILWQQLHNHLVDVTGSFTQAKLTTIAIFHAVIIGDYLFKILDTKVYTEYFTFFHEHILKADTEFTRLPLEFSHAVFRFGHSMIQQSYQLKPKSSGTNLEDLLRGNSGGVLPSKLRICWEHFFNTEQASPIDTAISPSMGCLPQMEKHIVKLNLRANNLAKLPSGFAIYNSIQCDHQALFDAIALKKDDKPQYRQSSTNSVLKELYNKFTLPLWLYTLEESVIKAPIGHRLGKIASIIIAETIRKSIQSYYSAPKFKHIAARIQEQIENIPELVDKKTSTITMPSLIKYIRENCHDNQMASTKCLGKQKTNKCRQRTV